MALISKILVSIGNKPPLYFQNINVQENIYGIDTFEITCRYDSIEKLDAFLIANASKYLGLPVSIQIKTKVGDKVVDAMHFKGIVTEIQGTRSGMDDDNMIVISGGSMEILMNGKPNTRAFTDKTLKDIVKEVLDPYPSGNLGFGKNIAPRDNTSYPYIVQYKESDIEFLKRLSIRYGEWFFFDGKDVIFGGLPANKQDLTIGRDLNDFTYQLRINPINFMLLAGDPLKPNVYNCKSGSAKIDSHLNAYGKHAVSESKKQFSVEGIQYYEHLNEDESNYQKALEKVTERDAVSDALNLSDLSGSSTNAFLTAGMKIKVGCPKKDSNGDLDYLSYIVTSVQHRCNNLRSYSNSFSAIPEESKIPENTDPYFIKTSLNQVGKIADNQDPKKLGRVRINFPWMKNGQMMTPWVKVVTPYTHENSGFYFVPAVNSRVLVGFEGGDVEKPICMGAMFDETHQPDAAWAGDYNNKDSKIHAIRTVSGQTIELHDESGKEKIRIYDTDNKNEITLDTANGEITIKATEKLTIEAKEIEIKAQNGMKIEAGQRLEYKANEIKSEAQTTLEQKAMEIKTEAQTSLEVKATTVEIKATASLKAEGSASAEVSSSGVTTVKGSMVMIN